MHHGPLAAAISISLCATVRPMPFRFLGTGGSLAETGFVFTSPHLIPATFRTVLAERGRDAFVRRWWPPLSCSLFHSRLRCSGVISPISIFNSSGSRYAACS